MGAAVVAQSPTPVACLAFDPDDSAALRLAIESIDVIAIGEVERDAEGVHLVPEVFLEGPATDRSLPLDSATAPGCDPATLEPGQRVLVALRSDEAGDASYWPASIQSFLLEGGTATGATTSMPESELVDAIRGITGQFAEPADNDSGITLDLTGTIIPLGIALALIFIIGIVLMRIWHAIDPS